MLGHDALCLWTMLPVPQRKQAATCVTSSWQASRNMNAKFPYSLWGARAIPSILDGYVGINRREDTIIVLTSLKKAWREASNSHPPSRRSLGVDAFSPTAAPANFHFVNFWERGFPFNFLWHHVCIFVIGGKTGSEKPVAVRKLWGICHKQYVIPT